MAGPSTSAIPSGQYVVVWEWLSPQQRWRPYSPYVSQSLERAYSKKLNKLMLGDTEPALSNYFVQFERMEQVCNKSDTVYSVRRVFYPQFSPAGCGRLWEWRDNAGWKEYDMEIQFLLDDTHNTSNVAQVDLSKFYPNMPYVVDLGKKKQIRKDTKYQRDVQCVNIASYPIMKPTDQDIIITLADIRASKSKSLMGKITSLVKSISVPASPKKTNTVVLPMPAPRAAPDLSQVPGPSKRVRRPSSDTVSTYLSKDSGEMDSNENLVEVGTSKSPRSRSPTSPVPQPQPQPQPPKTRPNTTVNIVRNSCWTAVTATEDCTICYIPVQECGGYGSSGNQDCSVALERCGHSFHLLCLEQMASGQTSIRCPNCNELYGIRMGNMPRGTFTSTVKNYSLPGHEGSRTIEIVYEFSSGIQGPEHPHPGRPYHATGFPRIAYLPDIPKAEKVLQLLKVAFERRLTFTIGRSVTTGQDDVITWNEIHHKTSKDNRNGHGYPDPKHLDSLLEELAGVGVS